jgi:AraC-like DNA-binding protein
MMENYHKYLPVSDDEKNWGLWVLNAGFTNIKPSVNYPFKDHPSHHFFNWAYGRTLQEYQIIYITRGEGTFESDSCAEQIVEEGTIIFLFPGEWHRYKPNENTGWDEYWIGVSGSVVDNLLEKEVFHRTSPLLHIGFNEEVFDLLTEIIEKTKLERPGYQAQISGAAFHLLGNIHAISKGRHLENVQYIELINKSKILFRANVRNDYSPEMLAEELLVSYSWFRKTFKSYTGMSPGQYFIDLKIQTAKELLSDPCCSMKCIASELRFSSVFHFSNLFKEKTGFSPIQYKYLAINGNMAILEA